MNLNNRRTAMNSEQLKGKWNQLKGAVRAKWGQLTDDDLDKVQGDAEKLMGKLQERYGIEKEAAKKQYEEWLQERGDKQASNA
tara:strand:+ start:194705 stop:194953 length:249 start_codon:yes stop_codon:yes gene_type:complete